MKDLSEIKVIRSDSAGLIVEKSSDEATKERYKAYIEEIKKMTNKKEDA